MGCMNSKCFGEKDAGETVGRTASRRWRRKSETCRYNGWRDISTFSTSCGTSEIIPSAATVEDTDRRLCLADFAPIRDIHVIGVGGFGIVRCVQKNTGPDQGVIYALKSMSKEAIISRASGPAAVEAELRALIAVRGCPFVSQIQYAFQSERHLFLVLNLAEGGDMRCNLRARATGRFSEQETAIYATQLFLALDHCHRCSVLHRDVKPENILMKTGGWLQLSDFGVAKHITDIENCKSTSGTHGYMAPEMYAADHRHGTAAEWFAVGVTLHEFLTGHRPFEVSRLQSFRIDPCDSDAQESNYDSLQPLYLQQCQYLSASCKAFITRLLHPHADHRLGAASAGGLAAIFNHNWISQVNIAVLRNNFNNGEAAVISDDAQRDNWWLSEIPADKKCVVATRSRPSPHGESEGDEVASIWIHQAMVFRGDCATSWKLKHFQTLIMKHHHADSIPADLNNRLFGRYRFRDSITQQDAADSSPKLKKDSCNTSS